MTDKLDYGIMAIILIQLMVAIDIKFVKIILGIIALFCVIGFGILRD